MNSTTKALRENYEGGVNLIGLERTEYCVHILFKKND